MQNQRKRNAGLFARMERLFIQPYHQTTDGVLIGAGPVEVLEQDVSDTDLGQALRVALNQSGRTVPHPADWGMIPQPLNKAAGAKSWSAFVKGTTSCEISDDGQTIKITPTRNAGSRVGFLFLNDLVVEVSSGVEDFELGSALRRAIASAK